jgi:hypothetical protein
MHFTSLIQSCICRVSVRTLMATREKSWKCITTQWTFHRLRKHKILRDSKNVRYINSASASNKVTRWRMILDEHEYVIAHIPGKTNSVDAISRLVSNAVPDEDVSTTLREEWLVPVPWDSESHDRQARPKSSHGIRLSGVGMGGQGPPVGHLVCRLGILVQGSRRRVDFQRAVGTRSQFVDVI